MSLFGRPNVSKLEASRNVPKLITALEHSDSDVSRDAAEALGRIGDTAAVGPLVAVLRRKHLDIMRAPAAARALGSIGDPRAVDALTAALGDQNPYVPDEAERSLSSIGGPRAVDALTAALSDPRPGVGPRAARVLGSIGDPRAVEALTAALSGQRATVRRQAAGALGSIGGPQAVDALTAALSDPDPDVRSQVAEALGSIGAHAVDRERQATSRREATISQGITTLLMVCSYRRERLLGLNEDPTFKQAVNELGREGPEGAKALAALIDELLAARCAEIQDVLAAARFLLPQPDLVESVQKVISAPPVIVGQPGRFPPVIVGGGKIGWDDGTAGRIKEQASEVLAMLGTVPEATAPRASSPQSAIPGATVSRTSSGPSMRNEMDRWPRIVEQGAVNPSKETKVTYTLTEGCMGSPMSIQATTEQVCVYCRSFAEPEFHDPVFPDGGGYCQYWNGAVGMKDSCIHFMPNTKVRGWLSKGYMLNNRAGYPRNPSYQVFDDAPDGERGAL